MLNNFISGGQVFLHKIRMFKQVALSSFFVSFMIGILFTGLIKFTEFQELNKHKTSSAWVYAKAELSLFFDDSVINIFPHSPDPKIVVNNVIKKKENTDIFDNLFFMVIKYDTK